MSSPASKEAHMTEQRKKLIEVALPLAAINKAAAHEKLVKVGKPTNVHLWWARRPLAAARAVIFAQMVDDPSSCPDLFPTEKAQQKERRRLFGIIEELVKWENTTSQKVLEAARAEIWQSWRRCCAENADHPRARDLFVRDTLPAFHDPFAGGGVLPLEAQRLGLEAFATDLNPVAVLINKALIEIQPRFAQQPPVNPDARSKRRLLEKKWCDLDGLTDDVHHYGKWMRDQAKKRIGHLYPKVEVTTGMVEDRPDLDQYLGEKLTVIAWVWARTAKSPNPAFADTDVPLASTFILSSKKGKEAYVEPILERGGYRFAVRAGKPKDFTKAKRGTKADGSKSGFLCLMSGTPLTFDYLRSESQAGRTGARLMAIVAEGNRGRVYLSPTPDHEAAAQNLHPTWQPDVEFFQQALGFRIGNYGMTKWCDLFTARQLVALTTLSDLTQEVRERVKRDAISAGVQPGESLSSGGTGAAAYADALTVFLALALSRVADWNNSLSRWESKAQVPQQLFGRQTISMVWDYSEANPLSSSTGSFIASIKNLAHSFAKTSASIVPEGRASQDDACVQSVSEGKLVSTDPPYYDNIGYGDLSDFFYVWLRRSLKPVLPDIFATLAVPKADELVATPDRHGGKDQAEDFFLNGMTRAMQRLAEQVHPAFPVTIYYAFKQSETKREGTASTGWETFLDAVLSAGFAITGTWPVRTENTSRLRGQTSNALASSIVLVCRQRPTHTRSTSRREFVATLKAELPDALAHLQKSNIAPVDLAQAAIGPGMAVYTRYSCVLESDGSPLSVRTALALINQVLDEVLAEQEGDFDPDSRWALAWFEQSGFDEGDYGVAETLSKAKNTRVKGLVDAGVLASKGGKVRLLSPADLPEDWDPTTDSRLTVWEMVHHLVRVLEAGGERAAAKLAAKLDSQAETARELAYRLYSVCERKKRASEALAYNGLVQSWPEIMRLARESARPRSEQADMFGEREA